MHAYTSLCCSPNESNSSWHYFFLHAVHCVAHLHAPKRREIMKATQVDNHCACKQTNGVLTGNKKKMPASQGGGHREHTLIPPVDQVADTLAHRTWVFGVPYGASHATRDIARLHCPNHPLGGRMKDTALVTNRASLHDATCRYFIQTIKKHDCIIYIYIYTYYF